MLLNYFATIKEVMYYEKAKSLRNSMIRFDISGFS